MCCSNNSLTDQHLISTYCKSLNVYTNRKTLSLSEMSRTFFNLMASAFDSWSQSSIKRSKFAKIFSEYLVYCDIEKSKYLLHTINSRCSMANWNYLLYVRQQLVNGHIIYKRKSTRISSLVSEGIIKVDKPLLAAFRIRNT